MAENELGEGVGAAVGADRVSKTQGAGVSVCRIRVAGNLCLRVTGMVRRLNRLRARMMRGRIQAASGGGAVVMSRRSRSKTGFRGTPIAQVLSTRSSTGRASRVRRCLIPGRSKRVTRRPRGGSTGCSLNIFQGGGGARGRVRAAHEHAGHDSRALTGGLEQTAVVQDLGVGCSRRGDGGPLPLKECLEAVAEHENVPAGTVFGKTGGPAERVPAADLCGPLLEYVTPDFSHVVVDRRCADRRSRRDGWGRAVRGLAG